MWKRTCIQFRNEEIDGPESQWVLDLTSDDRGKFVAEIWDKKSGKTLVIEEVNSQHPIAAAMKWARIMIDKAKQGN